MKMIFGMKLIKMENKSHEKLSYSIFPGNLILGTVGSLGSLIGIITGIMVFKGIYRLIAVLVILLIVLSVLTIYYAIGLKRVTKQHKNCAVELQKSDDNRDTLDKMIKDKNKEVDHWRNELRTANAQVHLLYMLLYSNEKPDQENLRQALSIDKKEFMTNGK